MDEVGVGLEIALGKVLPEHGRGRDPACGLEDVGGKAAVALEAGMPAADRRIRFKLAPNAVMGRSQDGGGDEIGIGVGAGDAMLDTPPRSLVSGYPQGDGAVVLAPFAVDRCEQ